MAVSASRVSVGTTATLLAENDAEVTPGSSGDDWAARSFALLPQAATGVVALGPAGVTTATGVRWDVALRPDFSIDLEPGEALYGIVASGTLDVDVLGAGR